MEYSVAKHTVRTSLSNHVLRNWTAIAHSCDGMHPNLGMLTTKGFVSDLPGSRVVMLRYWSRERTQWLRYVFGGPVALGAPALSEPEPGQRNLDIRHRRESRADGDAAPITRRSQHRLVNRSVPPRRQRSRALTTSSPGVASQSQRLRQRFSRPYSVDSGERPRTIIAGQVD